MMTRRLFAGLLYLAVLAPLPLAAQVVAQQAAASQSVPTAAMPASALPIAALNAGLVEIMQAGKSVPFATRMAILTPIVQKAFNLDLLLRNSIGPSRWMGIPDAQKAELQDVFTQFTVASYVANFDAFSGEKFVIAPDQRVTGNDKVVQTKILGASGDSTRIDYVMREEGGVWRVVDVLLDGSISRVAVTRSDFRSLLSQSDASPLIASLRGKVSNLSAGNAS